MIYYSLWINFKWRLESKYKFVLKVAFLYGSPYLPLPLPATIGQPEKQHKGSANREAKRYKYLTIMTPDPSTLHITPS